MNYQIHTTCSCRNEIGEPTRLGEWAYLLELFRQENPGVNITVFFEQENIQRLCCRQNLMCPYNIRLETVTNMFDAPDRSTYGRKLPKICLGWTLLLMLSVIGQQKPKGVLSKNIQIIPNKLFVRDVAKWLRRST